jgi:hypothetical protein
MVMWKKVGKFALNVVLIALAETGKQKLNEISRSAGGSIISDTSQAIRKTAEKVKDYFSYGS